MKSAEFIKNVRIIFLDLLDYLIELLVSFHNWISDIIRNLNSGKLRKHISELSEEIRSFIHDGTKDTDKEKLDIIVQHNELVRLERILDEMSKERLLSQEEKEKFKEKAEFIYKFCVKLDNIRKDRKYELGSIKKGGLSLD